MIQTRHPVCIRIIPAVSVLSVRQIIGKAFPDMLPIRTRSLHVLMPPGGLRGCQVGQGFHGACQVVKRGLGVDSDVRRV